MNTSPHVANWVLAEGNTELHVVCCGHIDCDDPPQHDEEFAQPHGRQNDCVLHSKRSKQRSGECDTFLRICWNSKRGKFS